MSLNALSVDQISLMCRHVDEAVAAGITFNVAVRSLEVAADAYAKHRVFGNASPHSARHVPFDLWSRAAKAQRDLQPNRPFGEYLRVEHGTPRRAFAGLILELHRAGDLSIESLNQLVVVRWRVAVITLDEDRLLNRSALLPSPSARWEAAGIEFG